MSATEHEKLYTELCALREALKPMAHAIKLGDADHMLEYMEGRDWDKLIAALTE